MRLIEARDRSIIDHATYLRYLAKGYLDGDEIGLNDQEPIEPEPDDIDFQDKKGVNCGLATLEDDVAALGNVRARVAKISIDHEDTGAVPVLVTDVPCLLLAAFLYNTELWDCDVSFGVAADHSKFVADADFDKSVNTEPDAISLGAFVAGSTTLNLYIGEGSQGVGDFYLVYVRLA